MTVRVRRVAVLGSLLLTVPATSAPALDGSVDLSVQSAYIWRGMVVNDRPVFQPSVTVNGGGFSGSVWANVNLTAANGSRGEASEIDYWAAYTVAGNTVDGTVTYYVYTFPHSSALSTQEVWANATLKNLPLSPSLTAIRDVDAIKGWYFLLTASQSLGLLKSHSSDGLTLTFSIGHGTKEYCRGYFPQVENEPVNDYGVRLDWPFRMGPGTLRLDAQLTSFADADVYTPGFEGKRANVIGGVVYSIGF